jgi:hypothetical protein
MVNLYVGITDYDWFSFLAAQPDVDEVNFWQTGGRTNFPALRPGELFLFKLHSPRNFIVGGGFYSPIGYPSDLSSLGSFRHQEWCAIASRKAQTDRLLPWAA